MPVSILLDTHLKFKQSVFFIIQQDIKKGVTTKIKIFQKSHIVHMTSCIESTSFPSFKHIIDDPKYQLINLLSLNAHQKMTNTVELSVILINLHSCFRFFIILGLPLYTVRSSSDSGQYGTVTHQNPISGSCTDQSW